MMRGMRAGENNNMTGGTSAIHKTILTSGVQVRNLKHSKKQKGVGGFVLQGVLRNLAPFEAKRKFETRRERIIYQKASSK